MSVFEINIGESNLSDLLIIIEDLEKLTSKLPYSSFLSDLLDICYKEKDKIEAVL